MSANPAQPSGRGLFSLEGRPAPGLYFIAWLLSGLGLGLLFVAVQTAAPVRGVLIMASLLLILLGLSLGAGYQVLARRARPEARFHGPSPLIVFAVQFALVNVVSLALLALGVPGADSPAGFFVATIVLLGGYAFVVWMFGVRSGAVSWPGLGLPAAAGPHRLASDVGFGVGVMLLVALGAGLWGGLLALLLGTRPPSVVPAVEGSLDVALIAVGAGLLVPIGEEMFFRGYAVTAWLRDLGVRAALLRSTLFFALVHVATLASETFDEGARQALLVVLVIAPVGLALGWLFVRRGLLAAIAGHAAYNLFGVLVLILSQFVPPPPV